MFGKQLKSAKIQAPDTPTQGYNPSDILSLSAGWAQNLADAANGVSGPSHIAEAQQMIAQRQQQAQQQQALAALMAQMKPQDTRAPVMNSMIDANNQRMMGYDGGAAQQSGHVDVGKAGLDFSNPDTLKAFMGYASMPGANAQLPMAISQAMQPDPVQMKSFNQDEDLYTIDPATGLPTLYQKGQTNPLKDKLLEAQIAATGALENQRGASARYYGVKADHPYAPQRPRAVAPAGPPTGGPSGALAAIEAELRRRGKIK